MAAPERQKEAALETPSVSGGSVGRTANGRGERVKRQSESSPTIFGVPALKLVVFEAPSV